MTDAVHMLTDVVGILFSLLALWFSNKPPTKRFSFGLHRLGKVPLPPVSFLSLSAVFCFEAAREVLSQQCPTQVGLQTLFLTFG